jgi:DNA polymerase III gamma/tau subunit
VLEAAAAEDVASALVGVHDLVASGHDVRRVADDLLRTLRDAFLLANAAGRIPYDGAPEECDRLAALAKEMGNPAVVRAIEILGDAIIDIRGQAVADPRLVLEVAVVRIARREARTREETLLDRVERLEQRFAEGGSITTAPTTAPASAPARPAPVPGGPVLAKRERAAKPAASTEPTATPEPAPAADAPAEAEPQTFALDDVIEAWPETLLLLKAPVRTGIQDAQPIALENGIIVFGVPKSRYDAINERFRKEAAAIKDAFAQRLGAAPRFMLRAHDFDKVDAFKPTTTNAEAAAPVAEPEDDEAVDLEELADAPEAPPPDSVSRLADALGAEVVDERRR